MTEFRILTACTGNVCRSPTAERLLRVGLRQRFGPEADGVQVCSAGTGALVGEAMTAETVALVARTAATRRVGLRAPSTPPRSRRRTSSWP